ncbi:unnamed protein product [Boreogadus saida]
MSFGLNRSYSEASQPMETTRTASESQGTKIGPTEPIHLGSRAVRRIVPDETRLDHNTRSTIAEGCSEKAKVNGRLSEAAFVSSPPRAPVSHY